MSADTTHRPGVTVWLTGLSGAGKSTVATALADRLRGQGRRVEILDGDEIRRTISSGLGFSRADRDTHVTRVGFVANLLSRNGVVTLVPVIAPYAETRAAVRAAHADGGVPFVEVYVATPLAECRRRDVKGLYAGAATAPMTGDGDPYEAPTSPDVVLDTTDETLDETVETLYRELTTKGVL